MLSGQQNACSFTIHLYRTFTLTYDIFKTQNRPHIILYLNSAQCALFHDISLISGRKWVFELDIDITMVYYAINDENWSTEPKPVFV